jgi:hypothetical protein
MKMKICTLYGGLTMVLMVVLIMMTPTALQAQFDTSLGTESCSDVKRKITRNWTQLRSFFRPGGENLRKPKTNEIYCVSPAYTKNAMKKSAVSMDLACYSLQGSNFCCDSRLQACAGVMGG